VCFRRGQARDVIASVTRAERAGFDMLRRHGRISPLSRTCSPLLRRFRGAQGGGQRRSGCPERCNTIRVNQPPRSRTPFSAQARDHREGGAAPVRGLQRHRAESVAPRQIPFPRMSGSGQSRPSAGSSVLDPCSRCRGTVRTSLRRARTCRVPARSSDSAKCSWQSGGIDSDNGCVSTSWHARPNVLPPRRFYVDIEVEAESEFRASRRVLGTPLTITFAQSALCKQSGDQLPDDTTSAPRFSLATTNSFIVRARARMRDSIFTCAELSLGLDVACRPSSASKPKFAPLGLDAGSAAATRRGDSCRRLLTRVRVSEFSSRAAQ